MAALKLNRLREIILQAYEAGFNGCFDLRDEYADELIAEIMAEIRRSKDDLTSSAEWRIYSVEELRKMPVGTVFEHSRLGQCWIDGNSSSDAKKCMTFVNGESSYFCQNNVEPWDEVMRCVGSL